MDAHIPVSISPLMKILQGGLKKNGIKILDATFGAGGYTRQFLCSILFIVKILTSLAQGWWVDAIDKDYSTIKYADFVCSNQFSFHHGSFSELLKIFPDHSGFYDAICFDLGVSSMQIDNAQRGFSFYNDGPLDMRMNTKQQISAYHVVNWYSFEKLFRIFSQV